MTVLETVALAAWLHPFGLPCPLHPTRVTGRALLPSFPTLVVFVQVSNLPVVPVVSDCGNGEIRTRNRLLAKQVHYQLCYVPIRTHRHSSPAGGRWRIASSMFDAGSLFLLLLPGLCRGHVRRTCVPIPHACCACVCVGSLLQ